MLDADRDLFRDRVHSQTIFVDIVPWIPKCQVSCDSLITYLRISELRSEGT